MKLLVDFFPVLMFVIAYYVYDIFVATAVAIAAAFIQVAYMWLRFREVSKMHWVTLGLLVVLGGTTLILRDEMFIKWKPTMVNWAFAVAFLGSQWIGKKTLVERMMSHAITAPSHVWTRLNLSWVGFFVVTGGINLFVVYNFSTEIWVNFKLWGVLGLTIVFVIIQGVFLQKYVNEDGEPDKSGNADPVEENKS